MGKKEKTGPRARDEGIRLIQKAQEKVTKVSIMSTRAFVLALPLHIVIVQLPTPRLVVFRLDQMFNPPPLLSATNSL